MGILRIIGNFFAYIIMALCITLIFLSLFAANVIKNTDNIENIMIENTKEYIAENKDEVKEFLMANQDSEQLQAINKEQLTQLCAMPDPPISQDLCTNLDSLTEQEAKNQVISDIIDNQLSDGTLDAQLEKISKESNGQIKEFMDPFKKQFGNPNKFVIIGIVGYLLVAGLIFVLNRFNVKLSLYKIGRNTFFVALAFIITFGYLSIITPEYIQELLTKVSSSPELMEVPAFMVSLIITIALDILKASTSSLLITAIVMGVLSLALSIIMRVLIKKDITSSSSKPSTKK